MPITVLLAEDMAIMRKAIRRLLEDEPGIEVVGEAANFAETIQMTNKIKPRIVVMDMHMPNEANLTAVEIKTELAVSGTLLLAISIWDDDDTKAVAESFGAVALLDKAKLGSELVPTIKSIAAN
jgi:DNA-binding NarL/FixJ family response regulator